MYHFFTETEFFTESEAVITGPDVNHIKNVLRMKPGEKLLLSDGKGTNCLCEITELFPDKVLAKILPEEVDAAVMLKKLRLLEEEEPELHVGWNEKTKDILIKVMGEVQIEVLKTRIEERFGVSVDFGTGHIVYRETIADTVEGVGHFEPRRLRF